MDKRKRLKGKNEQQSKEALRIFHTKMRKAKKNYLNKNGEGGTRVASYGKIFKKIRRKAGNMEELNCTVLFVVVFLIYIIANFFLLRLLCIFFNVNIANVKYHYCPDDVFKGNSFVPKNADKLTKFALIS